MKLKLLDYAGNKTIITLKKEITSIFYQMKSGDDTLQVLYKDGTTEYFDSSSNRFMDFNDGSAFIPVDKIKENKTFNVREWFEKE